MAQWVEKWKSSVKICHFLTVSLKINVKNYIDFSLTFPLELHFFAEILAQYYVASRQVVFSGCILIRIFIPCAWFLSDHYRFSLLFFTTQTKNMTQFFKRFSIYNPWTNLMMIAQYVTAHNLDILLGQITTFIKVRLAVVFGLQTL